MKEYVIEPNDILTNNKYDIYKLESCKKQF
jgi:hypothetical protein